MREVLHLDRAAAAAARAERVAAPADRPSQRRWAEDPSSRAWVHAATTGMELRADDDKGDTLRFEGMASVYEPSDHGEEGHVCRGYDMWDMFGEYTEYVHLGAGTASLAQPGLDVPLVLGHNSMQRLARTVGAPDSPLDLSELSDGDTPGLRVIAPSLHRSNPWVQQIEPMITSGLIDEMSFRFMITAGVWSEDWTEYHIHAYDIHRGDVSIVGYGANPHTSGSGFRSDSAPLVTSGSEYARARLALALAD